MRTKQFISIILILVGTVAMVMPTSGQTWSDKQLEVWWHVVRVGPSCIIDYKELKVEKIAKSGLRAIFLAPKSTI